MQSGAYISLAIYFIAMFSIGIYSYFATKGDVTGFMLGGRNLSPAVTALSAGASDMSGWILLGLPGAMYISGLSSAWIALGLILGAYLNYLLVAPRLRVFTELLDDAVTIPEYFERRFDDKGHLIRILSSVVIIIFFAIYTTSGVVAGGKLFESSFGLNYELGLFITAGVVVAYSTFGGFLAVSTTDFVQGCIMFLALILVPIVTLNQMGSVAQTERYLMELSPAMLTLGGGSLLGIISAASWGLGYFGQPHIIVRFMAIRSVREIKVARRIGMGWMIVSLTGAIAVGLLGAAYIKSIGGNLSDPETIFVFLSNTLFSPLVSGFLLAAILAAIMSTISSQLLVTSCSLTEDIYHTFLRKKANDAELVLVSRLSIVVVALLAIFLAHNRDSSILSLVSNAWAGFGAAFGPVVLMSLFWARMTRQGALAGIVVGASAVLLWIYGGFTIDNQAPSDYIYEIVPGFFAGVIAIFSVSLLTKCEQHTTTTFSHMENELAQRLS
jgi:SSS family solute:Na+ symporter/sodium/proline symporter